MAGLLAARALSDHFATVVIVERDRFPDAADQRSGVPQGRHAHALLERGRRILEAMMPGIVDEMIRDGARINDAARDLSWMSWAGEMIRYESGIPMIAASRVLIEHAVRRRVLALPNVTARQGVTVEGLDGSAQTVSGVRLPGGEKLTADFVVEASGRDSTAPAWLEALQVAPPAETVVKPFLGYASRWFEAPATKIWDRKALIVNGRAPHYRRGLFLWPIENDRYILTLAGLNGDHPPTREAEFAEFVASFALPEMDAWLAAARPIGPIHGFRFEKNRLRHFERCTLPAGFIAVGDAVASFNPVYGQGMTTSAIGVELLSAMLAEGVDDAALPRAYHRRLAKLLLEPWKMTTTEDLRYPGTEGARTMSHKIAYAYVDRLFLMAATEPDVRTAILDVFGMVQPMSYLFKPALAWRVLRTGIPRTMLRPQQALAAAKS